MMILDYAPGFFMFTTEIVSICLKGAPTGRILSLAILSERIRAERIRNERIRTESIRTESILCPNIS